MVRFGKSTLQTRVLMFLSSPAIMFVVLQILVVSLVFIVFDCRGSDHAKLRQIDVPPPELREQQHVDHHVVPQLMTDGIHFGDGLYKGDDLSETPGFPTTPLTVEQLAFCDPVNQYAISGRHVCEEDQTCRKCYAKHVDKNRMLKNAFARDVSSTPEFKSLVVNLLQEEVVVVSSVNAGQFYLFLNWYRSVTTNTDADPCRNVFLMATDQTSFDLVRKYTCIPVLNVVMQDIKVSEKYIPTAANILGHSVINNLMLFVANMFVQKSKNVLLHDVDNAWLHTPFDELKRLTTGADTSCMYAPYLATAKGICNTGFVYVAATAKSKVFWATLVNAMEIKAASDQALFDQMLMHRMFRLYTVRTLSSTSFAKKGQSKMFDRQATLVYHAVGINKSATLKKMGLWYLTQEEEDLYHPKQ